MVFQNSAGVQFEGTLTAIDHGFDGEDEYPIWGCLEGEELDFAGAVRWRFA